MTHNLKEFKIDSMPVNKDNVLEIIKQYHELSEYVLDEVLVKLQNLWPQVYTPNIFVNHVNFDVDEVILEYYDGQDREIYIPIHYLTLSDKELETQVKGDIAEHNRIVEWQKARKEREAEAKF